MRITIITTQRRTKRRTITKRITTTTTITKRRTKRKGGVLGNVVPQLDVQQIIFLNKPVIFPAFLVIM